MGTRKISQLDTISDANLSGEAILPVVVSDPLIPNRKAKINQLFRGVTQGTKAAPGLCFDLDRDTGLYQAAYDQIGTAAARKEYDQQIRMEEMFARGGGGFSGFGGSGGFRGGGFGGGQGFDFSDILNQFMGGMGGAEPQFQRQSRQQVRQSQPPPAQKGPDIEAGIDISLEQALSGTKIEFGHRRLRICERCEGNSFNSRKLQLVHLISIWVASLGKLKLSLASWPGLLAVLSMFKKLLGMLMLN